MLLIAHVSIALISIFWSAYALFAPSKAKLRGSYGLVASTLLSGTYLVVSTGSPLLKSCLTGLAYLGIVFAAMIATHHRLATAEQRVTNKD